MKRLLPLILLFSVSAKSQSFFEKVFGDSTDNSYAQALVQLPSGKLIVATNNANTSGNTIKLFVLDAAGNNLDTVSYNTTLANQQYINRMIRSDGFLYLAGYRYSGTSYSDGFLLKADTNGAVIWSKSYGDSITNESFQGIVMEGNFIYTSGYVTNPNGSGNSMYIVKLDTAGNFIWDYIYNHPYNSYSDAVINLPGGDVIASGDKSLGAVYTNFLLQVDSSGNYVWDFDIPNPYNNGCKNDFMSASGDIYIVGESASQGNFTFDPTVTRIDTTHIIDWSYTYAGSPVSTDAAMDIIEPVPENFLVTGYGINPANNSADVFLMRIDSSGAEINRAYFGDTTFDIAYAIIRSNNNAGCYMAGSTDRNGHNQNYLIYTGLLGIPTSVKNDNSSEQSFIISPNPCTDAVTITAKNFASPTILVSLTDVTGKYLIKDLAISGENNFHFSVAPFASGFYLLSIKDKSKTVKEKIIIQHN